MKAALDCAGGSHSLAKFVPQKVTLWHLQRRLAAAILRVYSASQTYFDSEITGALFSSNCLHEYLIEQ